MTRLGMVALACAALFPLVQAPAHAAPAPTVVTLRNGLRVLLAPDSSATAVDVAVWYPAGIKWEPRAMAGMSHLSSRLMFHGSKGVPDGGHVRQLLAEGANVNTTNTHDESCFWQTVPAEALPLALRLEADRMAGLSTSPSAFEAARADARADRRNRADTSPMARGLARLVAAAFPGEGYGRSPYGEDASLKSMTAKDVEAWRRTHFTPGAAVLTVVGRFEPVGTLAYVRSLFEPIPRGPATPAALAAGAPATKERRAWARGQTPLRIAFAGWRGPGSGDPNAPAWEVMAAVLGAEGSRLQKALESEWKVSVGTQSGLQMHRDACLLWVATALDTDADSSTAERVLFDEVGRLAREPLPDDAFARIRSRLVLDALFGSQSVRARAVSLGEAVFEHGDVAAASRRLERLEKLTPSDVQRAAAGLIPESARTVSWYVPAGEGR